MGKRKAAIGLALAAAVLGGGGAVAAVVVARASAPAAAADAEPVGGREEGATGFLTRRSTNGGPATYGTEPPAWTDGLTHLVVSTSATPTAADPNPWALSAAASKALEARLRAVPGVESVVPAGPGAFSVATSGTRSAVAAVPGVAGVGSDQPIGATAADPLEPKQWQYANPGGTNPMNGWPSTVGADMGAARAWAVTRGAGVIVGVVDTGVDVKHPDLAARIWKNPAENCTNRADDDGDGLVDDCAGWDFGDGDADPSPDRGVTSSEHGTHVAGLVAASQNGVGVVGAAPEATIMPLKVFNRAGQAGTGGMVAAIRYAVDHGAKVVNISMGTGVTARADVSVLEAAVAYARTKGVLIVASAGNSGADLTRGEIWPASFARYYDNVVAIGATTSADARARFSNFGYDAPMLVYAPGDAVLSTLPGNQFGGLSGTSMAAPLASGAAALVLASGRATTPAAVRSALAASAVKVAFGGSRIDAAVAVGLEPFVPPPPTTTTIATTTTTVAPTTTVRPTTTTTRAATTTSRPAATTTVKPTTTTARPTTTTARPVTTTVRPTTTTATPPVTTPVPRPVTVGGWTLATLSVRSGPLGGGRTVVATGRFPTKTAVQVSFGSGGPVVVATVAADGSSLSFVSPAVPGPRITEVTVAFLDAGRRIGLTMPAAFTFAANG